MLYGASGHGKVINDIISRLGNRILCFFDDDTSKIELAGLGVFQYDANKYYDSQILISIGDNYLRSTIVPKIKHKFATIIDHSVILANDVTIGEGSVLMHGSVIQTSTLIGKHAIINTCASIDHDNIIGDFTHISPNVTLCGGVRIGAGSHVGAGAVIIPGINIGKNCIIGAGAVVIKDIPDNSVCVGNPARKIKDNKKLI